MKGRALWGAGLRRRLPARLPVLPCGCFSERGSQGCGAAGGSGGGGGPGAGLPGPARPGALARRPDGRAARGSGRPPARCGVGEKFVGSEPSRPRPRAAQLIRSARLGSESCPERVTAKATRWADRRGDGRGCGSPGGTETRTAGGCEEPGSGTQPQGTRAAGDPVSCRCLEC